MLLKLGLSSMVDYYDAVLGLIPVSFLGLGGLLSGAGFPVTTAAPIASLIAAVLVFHALFVRGPDEARAETTPDRQ